MNASNLHDESTHIDMLRLRFLFVAEKAHLSEAKHGWWDLHSWWAPGHGTSQALLESGHGAASGGFWSVFSRYIPTVDSLMEQKKENEVIASVDRCPRYSSRLVIPAVWDIRCNLILLFTINLIYFDFSLVSAQTVERNFMVHQGSRTSSHGERLRWTSACQQAQSNWSGADLTIGFVQAYEPRERRSHGLLWMSELLVLGWNLWP